MLNSAGECVSPLSDNCKKSDDDTACAICHEGYYLETTCKSCNVVNCAICIDADICLICKRGYILYSDGHKPSCVSCTGNAKY